MPASASGVRRDKAALSSGCKAHPATAPAGSSRSSQGGNELAEAFGMRVTNWRQRECAGRNASERRASLEKDDAQADPTTLSGKADTTGEDERRVPSSLRRGSGDSMYTRKAHATREAPRRGQRRPTGCPRGTGRAPWGGGEVRSTAEAG